MVCAPVRRDNPRACTTMSSVNLAQYDVSLAKDWVSVECGTMCSLTNILFLIDFFFT